MAPLILDGKNMREKHQQLNSLVNETIKNGTDFNTILSESGDSDIDQLFKIDIANKCRNVEYILNVLQSEDMLYVSRAIKNITWLITDDQYSHIINPEYLHSQLFPHMKAKAICKLLLHIRLKLKDEERVDQFYKYYEENNGENASKWLPNCILATVEKVVTKRPATIKPDIFKRICEKHPKVFHKFIVKKRECYYKPYFQRTVFLLQCDAINYLSSLEKIDGYFWPHFSKRSTRAIMKNCPEKILHHKFLYFFNVHISTVAKYVEREKAKDVLLSIIKTRELNYWFSYKNIEPFIRRIPNEGKFEFIKTIFLDKLSRGERNGEPDLILEDTQRNSLNPENVYQWYRHAPFEVAFTDMKNLIKIESSPDERAGIFKVMLTTARRKQENISRILEFYHNKHIYEPYKYKISFINALIASCNIHKFDKNDWNLLEDLFHSADIYSDNENSFAQSCVEVIIIFKVIHREKVPIAIENKFKFNTLKYIKIKLDNIEREHVFGYLFNFINDKLNTSIEEKTIRILNLFLDWNKDLKDYPEIIKTIRELASMNSIKESSVIYENTRKWRSLFFEESLLFSRTETVFLNALKHDPTLFERHKWAINAACNDKKIVYERFLSKLRVYWPLIAENWNLAYKIQLNGQVHKGVVRALFLLMSRPKLLEILDNYAPNDPLITLRKTDDNLFRIRKYFAQSMHLARPQPPPNYILRYAIGDYMHYALSSINSIFYNMSSSESSFHIEKLLNVDPLQKHGIRIAFSKLNSRKLLEVLRKIWQGTQNAIIRGIIFESAFKLLCRAKNDFKAAEIWELLEMFVDNLTSNENRKIYQLLGSIDKVPKSLRAKYCMKSYMFLSKLPLKANCHNILLNVTVNTASIMDTIDSKFVSNILLDFIDKWFVTKKIIKGNFAEPDDMEKVFQNYLLCVTDEAEQFKRFNKVYKPWLKHIALLWDEKLHPDADLVYYFKKFLKGLIPIVRDNFIKSKYVNPACIFREFKNELESLFPIEKNYNEVTMLKIMIAYSECYNNAKHNILELTEDMISEQDIDERSIQIWSKIAPLFAKETMKLLNEDMTNMFPSIQSAFTMCFYEVYSIFENKTYSFIFEKELLKDMSIQAYQLTVAILPDYCNNDVLDKKLHEIKAIVLSHPSLEVKIPYYMKYEKY